MRNLYGEYTHIFYYSYNQRDCDYICQLQSVAAFMHWSQPMGVAVSHAEGRTQERVWEQGVKEKVWM
jgi:hypothetical protein